MDTSGFFFRQLQIQIVQRQHFRHVKDAGTRLPPLLTCNQSHNYKVAQELQFYKFYTTRSYKKYKKYSHQIYFSDYYLILQCQDCIFINSKYYGIHFVQLNCIYCIYYKSTKINHSICKVFLILLGVLVKIKLELISPYPKVEKHCNMLRIFMALKDIVFLLLFLIIIFLIRH